MDFDIAIIGGGIAGTSTGAALSGRLKAVILEAEWACGYHSTGRSAAFFLESYGGPEVARLNRASARFLSDPPRGVAQSGFLRGRGAIHLSSTANPQWPEVARREILERTALEELIPGLRPKWTHGLFEPDCADIDVARLHAAFLSIFRRAGGEVRFDSRVSAIERGREGWFVRTTDGSALSARILVNAAGAWADGIASLADVAPICLQPLRRTMAQVRTGRSGLRDLPLVIDVDEQFYFKGESDRSVWLTPHDETPCTAGDAAPEEIDIATAIDRFEQVVDWPVEAIERRWAGLRTFAPDRLPVYGFDPADDLFFWCVGQGGFGIQSSPAAGRLCADLLLRQKISADLADADPRAFSPARFR